VASLSTMKQKVENLKLTWENINIQINYNPDYSESHRKIMGFRLAHLEIRSEEPLPMTETGYHSHFTAAAEIENYSSPTDFVKAWLKEAAKSKKWLAYQKEKQQKQQLSLF